MKSLLFILPLVLIACGTNPQKVDTKIEKTTTAIIEDKPETAETMPCDPLRPDWPQFHRTMKRDSVTAAPAITRPGIRWRYKVGIQGWQNNTVIGSDTVFVGTSGQIFNKPDPFDGVIAIDLVSGESKWFTETGNDTNGLAIGNCHLFAGSDDGFIRAFQTTTGKVVWKTDLESKVYGFPMVHETFVFVTTGNGEIVKLEQDTGKIVWRTSVGSKVRGGVSSDGTFLFATTEAGLVVSLNADGTVAWKSNPIGRQVYAPPLVLGDQLVVGYARDTTYGDPAFVSIRVQDGGIAWHAKDKRGLGNASWGNVRNTPAVYNDSFIYNETYSNRTVAISTKTGETIWKSNNGTCAFQSWSTPAITGETLYVGRHDGGFYGLNANTGSTQWAIDLSSIDVEGQPVTKQEGCHWGAPSGQPIFSSPSIAPDGTILIGTGSGYLYALEQSGE